MKDFAERLKELRQEQNVSRETLAKKINVSSSAIRHWENQIREPAARHIITMAQFFGVSADYLLGLRDN